MVKVDNSSSIYDAIVDANHTEIQAENISIDRLYSVLNNAAVIGIYDKDGNGEIKIYDNNTSITELTDERYTQIEGYKFKGWFEDKEYNTLYEKQGEDYPKAQSGVNKDLYSKFVKEVKVTIGSDEPIILEEGQTLADIEGIDEKLEKLVNKSQNLKGYIMHSKTGGSISYTVKKDEIDNLKKYAITEDVIVEAVHTVTVKVNEKEFELDAGDTVEKIGTHADEEYTGTLEEYNDAKLNNKSEKEFSRLVYKNNNETFDEKSPINENIELITKHYAIVKLADDEYRVEEGQKISTGKKYQAEDESLVDAMKALKEKKVNDKTFNRFVDSEGNVIKISGEDETIIDKSTTIKPVYKIEIKIGEKSYNIDEGQSLDSLTEKESEIKKALKQLVTDAGEKNFNGFVVGDVLVAATKDNADTIINDTIMKQKLSKNTTIYAEYNAIVTIKCVDDVCGGKDKTFTIDTGKTLKDIETADTDNYAIAKYQKYNDSDDKEERFSRFVIDDTDEEFKENTIIEKSITLTPKYYAYVTIKDDREDVAGKYKVEEGKDISALKDLSYLASKKAQEALDKLRTDILPTEENNGENLHFEKLIISGSKNEEIPSEITEDITIEGLYHYDVIIVENYDNPQSNQPETHVGFKVYKGKNLNEHEEDIKTALTKLKKSATNTDKGRKFYSYWETNTYQEFTEEQESELLDKAFNKHIYITAKVSYKVEIKDNDEDYYVVESNSISSNAKLTDALNGLEKDNKQLDKYIINGNEVINKENVKNTIITESTTISATYNVDVTIGNKTYTIKEGGKLSDLDSDTQKAIKEELETLKDKEGFNFKGYNVGDNIEDVLDHTFNENTTIEPKFNIIVTIDEEDYESETGETLKDIKDLNLDTIKNKNEPNQVFSRFVDNDGNTFDEETRFEHNMELTTKYAYKITIVDGDSYKLEVNTALDENPTIKAKLDELANKEGKEFSRFVDTDGNTIDRKSKDAITKHTTIKPVYSVKATINGRDFIVDEGKSLNTYTEKDKLTEYLDSLEKVTDKEFDKYVVDGKELTREELLNKNLDSNVEVSVKYNVVITLGQDGEEIRLAEGSKYNDIPSEKISAVSVPETKSSIAYFVDSDGTKIDENYTFNTSMTIIPKYNVKVTITDVGYEEILEGSQLKTANNLLEKLNNNKDKDFKEFAEKTVLDDQITENVTLTPLYTITITVNGKDYTLDEGKTLNDLEEVGYKKPVGFKEFRDSKGNKIEVTTDLHKHTVVTAIYDIEVSTEDGHAYTLEAGQSLSSLDKNVLNALKINSDGRKFSRFVDQNGKTIEEDEPIYENISIKAKFNIKITVFRRDNNGNEIEDKVEFELGEDLPISKITEEENKKLQAWIEKAIEQLAQEGKENYVLSKYVDEEGNDIDLIETLFNSDSKIEAIFEYKKVETPVESTQPNNNNSAYPLKEKAPNTGVENDSHSIYTIICAIITGIFTFGCSLIGYKKIFSRR